MQAPVLAAPGLGNTGLIAVAHGLSCSAVCGVFLDQGSNPSPALAGGFFTTESPGELGWFFIIIYLSPADWSSLRTQASLQVWRLGSRCTGSMVTTPRLGWPTACGILVPQPGTEPPFPTRESGSLTTGPPGKSPTGWVLIVLWSASVLHYLEVCCVKGTFPEILISLSEVSPLMLALHLTGSLWCFQLKQLPHTPRSLVPSAAEKETFVLTWWGKKCKQQHQPYHQRSYEDMFKWTIRPFVHRWHKDVRI